MGAPLQPLHTLQSFINTLTPSEIAERAKSGKQKFVYILGVARDYFKTATLAERPDIESAERTIELVQRDFASGRDAESALSSTENAYRPKNRRLMSAILEQIAFTYPETIQVVQWHRSKETLTERLEQLAKAKQPTAQLPLLETIAREGRAARRTLGPRGTLVRPATDRLSHLDRATKLEAFLKSPNDLVRCAAAIALGEWGGIDELRVLRCFLTETEPDTQPSRFHASLLSAIGNLGGPEAVDALLVAAETMPAGARSAALVALEHLATDGSPALNESAVPASIAADDADTRRAFQSLAIRLHAIAANPNTPEYPRLQASELLELVRYSLRSA